MIISCWPKQAFFILMLGVMQFFSNATLAAGMGQPVSDQFPSPLMIKVPVGSFMIGSTSGQEDNKPPVKVKMNQQFAIGQHEVTFEQYDYFAKKTGRKLPDDHGMGRGQRPVINVTLHDARAYCDWLSKQTGKTIRLPTEGQWEYTAKYTKRNLYIPINIGRGDASCKDCGYLWGSAKTSAVGSFDANELGIYDLFGNVWEWTCSAYTVDGYSGLENLCSERYGIDSFSVRGGSWKSERKLLRPYIRYNNPAFYKSEDLGFRVVELL